MKQSGELVLLYHFEGSEEGKLLKPLLLRMGIKIKLVKLSDYNQPIGWLAGIKTVSPVKEVFQGEDFKEQMMIFHGFSGARLDELLSQMRHVGIPRIGLKAMITKTNMVWSSMELYQEIKKEHEIMSKGTS